MILDGRVHRGRGGTAGEFGHVCVDPAGPLCRCSNRGCLECYVLDRQLALVNHRTAYSNVAFLTPGRARHALNRSSTASCTGR